MAEQLICMPSGGLFQYLVTMGRMMGKRILLLYPVQVLMRYLNIVLMVELTGLV